MVSDLVLRGEEWISGQIGDLGGIVISRAQNLAGKFTVTTSRASEPEASGSSSFLVSKFS